MLKKSPVATSSRHRLPAWLKAPLPSGESFFRLRSLVRQHRLHTVCES
ncbi:MAG: lipoyl synthase, partial [Nitrospinae bacterium]|nr:lipoyl synthase [Nitrospinota bacterium]